MALVSDFTKPIYRTPATSLDVGTSAYAQNDALGTKIGLYVPASGIIRSVSLYDLDDEDIDIDVNFFRSEPTGISANSAFSLGDADAQLLSGYLSMTGSIDGVNSRIMFSECNIPYVTTTGRLWLQCVLRSASTPTFTSTGDMLIAVAIEH